MIFSLILPVYSPVYISDSERKELRRTQNQVELDGIFNQKKMLGEAYNAKLKHLDEREKVYKNELKSISSTKKEV